MLRDARIGQICLLGDRRGGPDLGLVADEARGQSIADANPGVGTASIASTPTPPGARAKRGSADFLGRGAEPLQGPSLAPAAVPGDP